MKEIRKIYYAEQKKQAKQHLWRIVAATVLLAISFFLEKMKKSRKK